ncbi:outer membrane protein assembly factor BamB family protein [Streptomyces sp. PTD5-9]|uniref:outer membrane protein assembly factor BamB family protein n=1 Tax=Streptomyces sp. PTD5-9 TaxID=3120150 RepID=UPI0030089F2E
MGQQPGPQPPQEGFGAPYDPAASPGPYGPPAQPGPYGAAPAQPGPYGGPAQSNPYAVQPAPHQAPSAPQAPPAQPNPYAQPGPGTVPMPGPGSVPPPAQPGPYGAAPVPAGPYAPQAQFGAGHPAPPSQPPTGPRSGGGGFFRGRRGALVGGAVAVALLAGVGIWLGVNGGGGGTKPVAKTTDGPATASPGTGSGGTSGGHDLRAEADALNAGRKPGEAKVLWLQEGGVDLPRNGYDVQGPWVVGDTVVKAMYRTVSGYSVADGHRKWSLNLSSRLCAAPSQATADGRIVLGVESGNGDEAICDSLQMVDLTTGKAGWHKKYERKSTWDALSHVAMAINGDTVTVGRTSRTDAFRVSDGAVVFGELPGNCQPFGFASGPEGIAATSCRTAADDHKEQQVQRIDPATGKVRWTYQVKKGWEVAQFYSVSPLVVSLKQEGKWAVIVLNEDGTYRSQLIGGTDDYLTQCDEDVLTLGMNLDNCLGVAADGQAVYLATKPAEDDPTNKVVAFDLNTGKAAWEAAAPAGQTLLPMRVEGARLLMYLTAEKNKGGGIASLPPTGGTPRLELRHPASAAGVERDFFDSRVVFRDGRCFLVHARISGIDDEAEMSMKSMAAFGN